MFDLALNIVLLCTLLKGADAWLGFEKRADTGPQPVDVPPSQYFDGNDGPWSTFSVQFGNVPKQQTLRLLPSISLKETFVVDPAGCDNNISTTYGCEADRGGLYYFDKSPSALRIGTYNGGQAFALKNLGLDDFAMNLTLETIQVGAAEAKQSVVARFTDWNFSILGFLGLNPYPTHFADQGAFNYDQNNLLWIMKQNETIPSESFGYTAGAYAQGQEYGSLVLGGYDESRFAKSDLAFNMYEDIERVLRVAVPDVHLSIGDAEWQNPWKPDFYTIDSTMPYLYFPQAMCDHLAKFLNLTWNEQIKHYLIESDFPFPTNDLKLSFTLAPDPSSPPGSQIEIELPLASLKHELKFPYVVPNESVSYFPLKPSDPSRPETLVLGRTFLQHAYVIADYERKEFSVHPTIPYSSTKAREIVPILPINRKPSSLPPSLLAAIIASTSITAVGLCLLTYLLIRRRRRTLTARRLEAEEEAAAARRAIVKLAAFERATAGASTGTWSSPTESTSSPSSADSAASVPAESNSHIVHEAGGELKFELDSPQHSTLHGSPTEMPDPSGGYAGQHVVGSKGGAELDAGPGGKGVVFEVEGTPVGGKGTWYRWGSVESSRTLVGTPTTATAAAGQAGSSSPAALASPIPATPLEYYGRGAGRTEDRGWMSRAPGVPRVVLTPATPVRENARNPWRRLLRMEKVEEEGLPPVR